MYTFLCCTFLAATIAVAGSYHEDQITAQQLADELGFQTRKVVFTFETPLYAWADFVTVEGGVAVHLPMTASKPQTKITFSYILRQREADDASITFQIGDGGITDHFHRRISASQRVHDAYPEINLPSKPDAEKPIYVFLNWDPDVNPELKREMPAAEIANKIKQGYYLAIFFSERPFPKP